MTTRLDAPQPDDYRRMAETIARAIGAEPDESMGPRQWVGTVRVTRVLVAHDDRSVTLLWPEGGRRVMTAVIRWMGEDHRWVCHTGGDQWNLSDVAVLGDILANVLASTTALPTDPAPHDAGGGMTMPDPDTPGLCQDCRRAPATVRITSRLVLCADCAELATARATLARLPTLDDPVVSEALRLLEADDADQRDGTTAEGT